MDLTREHQTTFEIEQLVRRFFFCLDERRFDEMADLMTPEGVWLRGGKTLAGRAMLLQAMADRGTERHTRHLVNNLLLTQSSTDSATAVFYSTAFVHVGELTEKGYAPMPLPNSIGVYTGQFERHDGAWKLKHMSSKPAFRRV